jgi:hypothetical protein
VPRRARRSESGGRRRYTSEEHRRAEMPNPNVMRRIALGIAPAAPVAPKMEVKHEDTNTRLGYPRGLPAPPGAPPKAKAKGMPPYPPYPMEQPPLPPPAKSASPAPPPKSKAKATPTAKKSAPPAPAPPDHGGAAVAIRSVPKAPMRPDDTRRMLQHVEQGEHTREEHDEADVVVENGA